MPRHPRTAPKATVQATPQETVWAVRALLFGDHLPQFLANVERENPNLVAETFTTSRGKPAKTPLAVRRSLERFLSKTGRGTIHRGDALIRNAELLAGVLGLAVAEREVLILAICLDEDLLLGEAVGSLLKLEGRGYSRACDALGHVLGVPATEVATALAPSGVLARAQLLTYDPVSAKLQESSNPFNVSGGLVRMLATTEGDEQSLIGRFLRHAPAPNLRMEDYEHMASTAKLVDQFLSRAVAMGMPGVNILVHGEPGTGKTQLARLVGANAGVDLVEAGPVDEGDDDPAQGDRLRTYQLTQTLLSRRGRSVLLVDEAEDLLSTVMQTKPLFGRRSAGAKLCFTRLLEENPLPAIWVSNSIENVDPALLRRFKLVVEVKRPPREAMRRVLSLALEGIPHDDVLVDRLAGDERLAPADVAGAVEVVRVLAPRSISESREALEHVLDLNLTPRMGPRAASYRFEASRFDPSLLNTTPDLSSLVRSLATRDHAAVCLYGPPGTGKTAFAHYVADKLGRPLLVRRASDLLSKWMGDNERNLAGMFDEARARKAVLLLDEADSFLRDRTKAEHAWEMTQVNELLVQMEAFEGIFFAATNFVEVIDRAAFRRFGLKVRFDALKSDQRQELFARTLRDLGVENDGNVPSLDDLEGLTPGDFKAARECFELAGEPPTAAALHAALAGELGVRVRRPARRVGFAFS